MGRNSCTGNVMPNQAVERTRPFIATASRSISAARRLPRSSGGNLPPKRSSPGRMTPLFVTDALAVQHAEELIKRATVLGVPVVHFWPGAVFPRSRGSSDPVMVGHVHAA